MRKIRNLNIVPDIYTEGIAVSVNDRRVLAKQLEGDLGGPIQMESRVVERGSESIECFYDAALAAPYILKAALQGERDGFDAVVLNRFLDSALSECRELLRIPVAGACQSGCSQAARLGGGFSVIGILENADGCILENLRCCSLEQQLASIPVIHTPMADLHSDEGTLVEKPVEAAHNAVIRDGARAVMGMDIASMVGNAFLVERVFNWPGFSKYGANAMITKDLNSICAVVLVIGATFLVVNLIVDVINAMVDPRIRLWGDLCVHRPQPPQ